MRARILSLAVIALLCAATFHTTLHTAQAADNLSGTYTLQGAKGAITLTLQAGEEGNLTGTLKGGDLQAALKGFPMEGGGVLGTLTGTDGAFMSYFQVTREGANLHFDIVQANADGDPDFTKKSRMTFPAGAAAPASPTAPKTEPAPPAPMPAPAANDSGAFAGAFKNDELTLDSKAEGGSYSGTIKLAGQTFKFTARAEGNALRGQFESPDGKFPFEATLDGRTLNFTTEGTTYRLAKQGVNPLAKPTNPLAKPNTPAPANPLAKANDVKPNSTSPATLETLPDKSSTGGNANWKIFKHATGLSVRYPPDWQAKMTEATLQLVPPNAGTNAQGPTEAYFLMAEGAEGVQSADDPRVAPFLDQQMLQLVPFLRRVGQPQTVGAGATTGVILSWEGTNPAGMLLRANVMVAILKGYAVALLALGDKAKIAQREAVLKEVFASLAAGVGERDPNLVGNWKFWSYKSSADGKFGSETTRRFLFRPDGTCYWTAKGENSGILQGGGGLASQHNSGVDKGQWTAANGQLYVLWDDGSTGTWSYEVRATPNGKRLFLKGNQAKPDEWVQE